MLTPSEHSLELIDEAIARSLREAKLRLPQACIEDIQHSPKRELERALINTLATGRWFADHQNVLITGMTGVGKTYVACALAQLACRTGFRALYRRASRLFEELAHADGTDVRLAKVDVLWGLAPLTDTQRRDVLEIMDDRHGARSTVLSQLPVGKCTTISETRRTPMPSSTAS